jgi:hypothetical protein
VGHGFDFVDLQNPQVRPPSVRGEARTIGRRRVPIGSVDLVRLSRAAV